MASNFISEHVAGTVYSFTEEPDSSLQCVVCLEIAEDSWQHILCKECLEKYGRDKPCPRREQSQYFEDNKVCSAWFHDQMRAWEMTLNSRENI